MKIPGLWRVRQLYYHIMNLIKKTDSKIQLRMERLLSDQEHTYIIRKIPLPSQSELAQINSRKELLRIAHQHDLLSFYASNKDKSINYISKNLYRFLFMIYKAIYKIMKGLFNAAKFLTGH